MNHTITVSNSIGRRINEPIEFTVPEVITGKLWTARTTEGTELLCQRLNNQPKPDSTTFVTVATFDRRLIFSLEQELPAERAAEGIKKLETREPDAWARLDTGYFDLEICSGTARGEGASKWGIRHFSAKHEGVDLLPSGNNAIGGFYGPFFTPENGLINPPEHTKVTIDVLEWGPVLVEIRMNGVVPNGLLEELKDKKFSITWRFTYGTPWFSRRYLLDSFETVINGRSITNKITVGDEFEAGQGKLVFDRFDTPGGARYRAGDPYASELKKMVEEVLEAPEQRNEKFDQFEKVLTGDMESAHWDLYWRLFSSWEQALPKEEIRERLSRVRIAAHVASDLPDRMWTIASEAVDVQQAEHETIFPGAAQKTVEYHSKDGRAMIWWTSKPAGQFQIVQRRQSGWVNWGSNGENECPELPVGVLIKTAYGQFAESWRLVADQLETPVSITVS